MPNTRNFEISYTKGDERKTFIHQADHFYADSEWQIVAQRFGIPVKDKAWGDRGRQSFKAMCIDAGYTDVSFIETP